MRILVTAFEPFGNDAVNASGEVVKRLPAHIGAHEIATDILPVSFGRCAALFEQSLARHDPQAVLCLGEAGGRDLITPEAAAVNVIDARIADNDGAQPRSTAITPGAPERRFATIDAAGAIAALNRNVPRAALSHDAGLFACNMLAYVAYSQPLPALFIHVPAVRPDGVRATVGAETDAVSVNNPEKWTFSTLTQAVEDFIAALPLGVA